MDSARHVLVSWHEVDEQFRIDDDDDKKEEEDDDDQDDIQEAPTQKKNYKPSTQTKLVWLLNIVGFGRLPKTSEWTHACKWS